MRSRVVLILALATINVEADSHINNVRTDFILQKLDHFDPSNQKKWHMRYMTNSVNFHKKGPIFINVGGEFEILEEEISKGHLFDMAKEFKAYLFNVEHRYFGDSLPTNNLSVANLKYLTIQQVMEDLAHFIRTIKKAISSLKKSKVILFGNSYSGGLVFWFKHLYPDLVDGVFASSPCLIYQLEFEKFYNITFESIKLVGGGKCFDSIVKGMVALLDLMNKDHEDDIVDMLDLCTNFDTSNYFDVMTLFSMIDNIFGSLVMKQSPADDKIEQVCKTFAESKFPVLGIIAFLNTKFTDKPCTDATFENFIRVYSDLTLNTLDNPRLYEYLKCTALGWFFTIDEPYSRISMEFHFTKCSHIFGKQLDISKLAETITQSNKYFESLKPQLDKIFVTHGQLDPYQAIGKVPSLNPKIIPMYGHGRDLDSISPQDTPSAVEAKDKLKSMIREWIKK